MATAPAADSGVRTIQVTAGAAISKGRFIVRGSNGLYQHCGAGLVPDGVSMEAASGSGISIAMAIPNGAQVIMETGAAVTDGTLVKSDANGKAINYTVGAGISAAGRFCSDASGTGLYVTVQAFNSGSPATTTG